MAIPGTFPLQYIGVNAPNPAQPYIFQRDPTVTDYIGYNINDVWLNQRKIPGNPPTYNTSHIWQLVSKAQNIGTWVEISHTGLTEDLPAHSVVLGLGVPGLGSTGPGVLGQALVAQGSLIDPEFGVVGPNGGGTGLSDVPAHNLLVGNGDFLPMNLIAPSSTTGQPLVSNGASIDPSFGTASVSGGGTGLDVIPQYTVVCGGITGEGPLQTVAGLGTMGQVLTSQGLAALPQWADGSGGGGNGGPIAVQVFDTPGSFTYTPTLGMASCFVEVLGGGGGAAYTPDGVSLTSGGGGGGYSRKFFLAAAIGSSQPLVVGDAGVGGVAPGDLGTSGGATTFGTGPILTANGGTNGNNTATDTTKGGIGGTASGGDINVTGQEGGRGFYAEANAIPSASPLTNAISGSGANSFYGAGGASFGYYNTTTGSGSPDASSYGSGGSGSGGNSVNDGGNGAGGLVIITEFGPYAPTPPPNAVQLNMIVFDTPGADTYTPSAGMFQCIVECQGGGSGGGIGGDVYAGSSGGYCKKLFDSAAIGASQSFVVGAAGVGAGVGAATAGGDTTFGAFLSAGGGPVADYSTLPVGGLATGGDININGEGCAYTQSGPGGSIGTGQGQNSLLGIGGRWGFYYTTNPDKNFSGTNATGYGAGGGQGGYGSTIGTSNGGNGSGGVIIITEYIS